MKTHKMSNSPIHKAWMRMNSSCNNPNNDKYHRYGGRGIQVCERWKLFESFYEDLKDTWEQGLTLERIDNDKNYEPNNVKWATWEEQFNNRSTNVFIICKGITKTVSEFAKTYGISRKAIEARLKIGWSHEDSVLTPIKAKVPESNIKLAISMVKAGISQRKAASKTNISRSSLAYYLRQLH